MRKSKIQKATTKNISCNPKLNNQNEIKDNCAALSQEKKMDIEVNTSSQSNQLKGSFSTLASNNTNFSIESENFMKKIIIKMKFKIKNKINII